MHRLFATLASVVALVALTALPATAMPRNSGPCQAPTNGGYCVNPAWSSYTSNAATWAHRHNSRLSFFPVPLPNPKAPSVTKYANEYYVIYVVQQKGRLQSKSAPTRRTSSA